MNPVSWRRWLLVGWRVAPLRQRLAWAGATWIAPAGRRAIFRGRQGSSKRRSGWRRITSTRTADGTEWHITIPVDATARIVLPAGAIEDLREGPGPGVPVGRADGIRDAHMEGGIAVVNAGSGTYRFVSRPRDSRR